MTTASLSGLLTRVGSLTNADVRELEKLADSYPYCQTAHLLLAKALHDRGSVLAGQKLRRAATGAPDRRALRRLLLLTAPAESLVEAGTDAGVNIGPAPALAVSAAGELVAHPEAEEPAASAESGAVDVEVEAPTEALVEADTQIEEPAVEATALVEESVIEATAPFEEPVADLETYAEASAMTNEEPTADIVTEPTAELVADAETELRVERDGQLEMLASSPETPIADADPAPAPVLADFDLVPDTTPAAGELRLFEDDEHAAPVGLTLLPVEVSVAPTAPALEPDPAVAYWVSSSRLGVELTAADFAPTAADGISDPPPAADLTAPWLPLAPPDARWTEHVAAHQPPAPDPAERRPFDHQFALIDRFLREKPRLRALDPTRPLPEKLPDLALSSTRPDDAGVVSESIARILARQGKTARAVAMYEQLQARLPEKAAIFAARIAALRGSAGPG